MEEQFEGPKYEVVSEPDSRLSRSLIEAQSEAYWRRLRSYQSVKPMMKTYTDKDVRFSTEVTRQLQALEALKLKPMEKPFEEEVEEKEQLPLGTVTYDSRYYGDYLFYDPKRIVQSYNARLASLPEHDTLIGTGLSGSLAVALIGHSHETLFAVLRKEDAHSHSSRIFEGRIGTRWLFVDDFVSSGKTKRRVLEKMKYHHPDVEYVGTWTYSRDEFTTSAL